MHSSRFRRCRKVTAGFLTFLSVFALVWPGLIPSQTPVAEAAEVSIDPDVSTATTEQIVSGTNVVFTSDQVGYKFFVDAGGYCVYRKTTDGGSSWGATTTVDAQTDCAQVSVWYDKWTPGSGSSSIHIATIDPNPDAIWYNRLDTDSDSLLMGTSPVNLKTGSAQGGTSLTAGENFVTITRATDGTLYALSNDGTGTNDSFVVECTVSCNATGNWTERTPLPLDVASDQNIMVPLDGGDIMIIQRDISANLIRSRVWDEGGGSWGGWTTIDPGQGGDNTTYDVGFAATVSSSTPGRVYLAYAADYDVLGGSNEDVRVGYYDGTSWSTSTLTNVVSNSATRAVTGVAIALDTSNEDVYVAYSARTVAATANTARVYWKMATSSMKNWSAEQGPVDASADDIYGLAMNIASDERLHVSWYEAGPDDMFGDTIADIFPGVHASSSGTSTATVNASTTNVYLGGKFTLYNTYKPMDVTGITLTESGTIDGFTNIANVKLQYESDTSAPYDCVDESYDGSESPFGSVDTNGFSGADGTSGFSGTSVEVSTTSAMCVYVVLDVLDSTPDGATIDISIANPVSDITATGQTGPATAQNISGTTAVLNDEPTQTHFHWRNDNGDEASATSRTSNTEDTALLALQQGTSTRLRMQVSNEGGSSTPAMQYRIEYALNPGQCSDATGWTDVGAGGGDFDMHDSPNLTDGSDTTNVALLANGAVTDENTNHLSPNGAVRDTSSQTGNIVLSTTQFVEFEYSIIASTTATEGNSYCFRLTDRGNPLFTYSQYPRANIAADISVTATGTQIATTNLPATNFYVGGAYVITDNTNTHNVTSITVTASGTVDIQDDITNIRLYYDLDTSAPYDCSSESYGGGEPQYGATSTAFSAGATSTFTGSVAVSTTSTMCVYTVLDTASGAQNGETVEIILASPATNVVVGGGASVSPTIDRNISGFTTFQGAVLTQTHYHWRDDNGSEATASSTTDGGEDTSISSIASGTPLRLRIQVSNEGAVTSASRAYTLEYGAKVTTCDAVSSWTSIGNANGAFRLYDSINLTDGDDTTDVSPALGGVTNPGGKTFLTPNSAVKDTSPYVASTTLTASEFIETEFSIQSTADAGFDIPYCFRLSTTEVPLNAYSVYPELRTSPERDFEIQRGTVNFSANSVTLTAGVDYVAPSASTSAFVRITNSHHTGAGDSSAGGNQASDDVTAYILNSSNITTSFTIQRPAGSLATTTRVSWEIIEFIGEPGSDNEMIVRSQTTLTYGTASTSATGTVATSVVDDNDVVVFITGIGHPDTATTNYNSMQSTSEWADATNQPVFTRGVSGGDATIVSYAVVEFTGQNWAVQRSEHTYTVAGTTQTEPITAVNSLSRTFLHTQKRVGNTLTGMDEFGAEVWLSSIGQVSYFLQTGAGTSTGQVSVAWVIENTQTTAGAMDVTRSNYPSTGGAEPLTISVPIGKTLTDITNASIFINNRAAGTGTNYPRPILGATIASTTHYELWRSDTGTGVDYRTEIVEWPTAGLALKQTHYRLYVDNNTLTPAPEWPAEGGGTLGEDTSLTAGDNPLGEGERIRIRLAIQAQNATLPAGTRAFKLQYGQMTTSCSAVSEASWATLGDSASSTIWRGYNATGTADGTALPSTLIVSSDVAGTFEEANDTDVNASSVQAGDEIEYDWIVEQNGATAETDYCFRMVESNGTPLDEYSSSYPQIRTASFTPRSQNWRWYDDEGSETPTIDLGNENVAPADIPNGEALKLRVTVSEIKNIARDDVRFKLQYSEYANFTIASDVVATTTCTATSTWCYANGGGVDNAVISTALLSDADACVGGVGDGCGTHNESPDVFTGFRHEASASTEYEFTIQSAGPRVNRVYYFRLYDTVQDIPVPVNNGEQYPSLVTEGASLTFTMEGLTAGASVEGVTLDISTTPTTIPFGVLTNGTIVEGAHRLAIDANGTEGYQLFMTMTGDLTTSGGATIEQISGTNGSPVAWSSGCVAETTSCFGYHTGDDTLEGGSTRFSAIDTYARLSTTTLDEVSYSSQPVVGDTTDIVFRILVRELQDAGIYETNIVYVSVPIF